MFLLKLLRKVGKLVRGGAAPRQIALGGLLGVVIGMIPGFNLSVVLAVVLLLLLNAHVGIALLGFALGKACCLLLAPVTFRLGQLIVHGIGLEGLFRALADTPVVALLDLHVYSLTGGLPVALLIGALFAWLMVRTVMLLRRGIVEAAGRSERMKKLAGNPMVRLFLWLVFGKRKGDMAEMLAECPPLLRRSGVILVIAFVGAALAVQFLLLDVGVDAGLERGLGAANGAEVNVGSAGLSLTRGDLRVHDLQVTDPEKPTHNSIQAGGIEAELSVSDLLRRRFVVDLLAVRGVEFDTQREAAGAVFERRAGEEPQGPAAGAEGRDLFDYFEHLETVRKYAGKLYDYLVERRAAAEARAGDGQAEKEALRRLTARRGYLSASAKGLLSGRPAWVLRQVSVEGVTLPGLAGPHDLKGVNVTGQPELLSEPMSFRIVPEGGGEPTGVVEFHFDEPGAMHVLELRLRGIPLGGAVRLSDRAPLAVRGGSADVVVAGEFSRDELRLPFAVDLTGLVAEPREGEGVFGLDPELAGRIFESLRALRIEGALGGSLASPRVRVDMEKTLAHLKDALREAGKEQLARLADEKLEEVKEELTGRIEEELRDRVPADIIEGLPGLGGREEEADESEQQEEEGVGGALRGLF